MRSMLGRGSTLAGVDPSADASEEVSEEEEVAVTDRLNGTVLGTVRPPPLYASDRGQVKRPGFLNPQPQTLNSQLSTLTFES